MEAVEQELREQGRRPLLEELLEMAEMEVAAEAVRAVHVEMVALEEKAEAVRYFFTGNW